MNILLIGFTVMVLIFLAAMQLGLRNHEGNQKLQEGRYLSKFDANLKAICSIGIVFALCIPLAAQLVL